ncbi:MAG: metallophosphoesterase, partial [Kofleriaceae bacterium]|nr:metallophosphoesterase [Kofleriaceae bacterium]
MARYGIGDLQGCKASLDRLLERIEFRPGTDHLWLVGDLVNRGPRSLDVLRWARDLGDAATVVLGNHDLHLLARAAGVAAAKKRDT